MALRALVSALLVIIFALLYIFYWPSLYDAILARQFQPNAQIAAINSRLKLTDQGTNLFYASVPTVQNQDQFNTSCESTERTTAMLGCYFKRHIYLYNVTNKDLDGAVEVAAAHEMLHAAYDRLNYFDRMSVDRMVQEQYEKIKDDPEIKSLMAYYNKAEPGSDINELHSIIGTTISSVSPELEAYYKRYFTDRSSIVALNAKYTAVFKEVESQSKALSAQIETEKDALKSDLTAYDVDRVQLETDIDSFNERAKNGGFSSQSALTAARNALLARTSALNARRLAINERVAAYNQTVAKLNALSVKVGELNKSMNGITTPASGV